MTKDEILNMRAGREMDKFIQDYLFKEPPAHDFRREVGDYNQCQKCSKVAEDSDGDILASACEIPDAYSTDIAAAWQVVSYFDVHGRDVDIANIVAGWRCEIDKKYVARDLFAPVVICRAAMLAIAEGK